MRLNPENNPLDYREEFISTGSVTIRNFLDFESADKIRKFFEEDMPSDWWYSASCPGNDGVDYIRNFETNSDLIKASMKKSNETFANGGFSYFFYRTLGDHVEGCYCDECHFRKWLKSEEVLQFIQEVSGIPCTNYDTVFGSKYSEGCFLSPHHDQDLGNVGFVFQLTRDWNPEWGGLLHFMSDDRKRITGVEVPTFNSLTLFYLPDGKGTWHYVSHVNPEVKRSRLAYTGWYIR
jgi:Rps23 Pro-64 3,4-dihydroxylase Tpa1-like proline 4-hydroxylase